VDPAGGYWPNKKVDLVGEKWSGVAWIGYPGNQAGEVFKIIMVEVKGQELNQLRSAEQRHASIPEIPSGAAQLDMIQLVMGKPCKK